MGKPNDKISEEKMDQAVKVLQEIMTLTQKYNDLFKTFTKQERHLAGGVVFRIRNVWNDFSLVGIMADRELAREMIDVLVAFYQNPEAFAGLQDKPGGIEAVNSKIKDDLSN